VRRQSHRPAALPHAGDDELGADQNLFAPTSLLDHVQRGAAQFAAAGDNFDRLVETGRLDLSESISATLPLERAADGVEMLETKQGDPVRILLVP